VSDAKLLINTPSPEMRFGFTGMSLKQNDSHCCGIVLLFRAPNNTVSALEYENSVNAFCYRGIVLHEIVPEGQADNEAYLEILRHVKDAHTVLSH
jgi:hypothetical protein